MPGTDRREAERIEAGWRRLGYEDGRAGRERGGPDPWMANQGAGMGLDTRGAYDRGYELGAEERYEHDA